MPVDYGFKNGCAKGELEESLVFGGETDGAAVRVALGRRNKVTRPSTALEFASDAPQATRITSPRTESSPNACGEML